MCGCTMMYTNVIHLDSVSVSTECHAKYNRVHLRPGNMLYISIVCPMSLPNVMQNTTEFISWSGLRARPIRNTVADLVRLTAVPGAITPTAELLLAAPYHG